MRLTFLVARVKRHYGQGFIIPALQPLLAIRFSRRHSPSSYAASDTSSQASPSVLLFVLYQNFTHNTSCLIVKFCSDNLFIVIFYNANFNLRLRNSRAYARSNSTPPKLQNKLDNVENKLSRLETRRCAKNKLNKVKNKLSRLETRRCGYVFLKY